MDMRKSRSKARHRKTFVGAATRDYGRLGAETAVRQPDGHHRSPGEMQSARAGPGAVVISAVATLRHEGHADPEPPPDAAKGTRQNVFGRGDHRCVAVVMACECSGFLR